MSEEHKKYGIEISIPEDVYYGRRDWTEEELRPGREALEAMGASWAAERERAILEAFFRDDIDGQLEKK